MENRDKDNMDIEELRSKVRERFAIDTRALAAFRISLGLLLLADLLLRSRDLVAFYTDSGVLPRQALQEHSSFLYSISLHTLSGDAWFQALLFVIAGVLALSLLFGYRTRTVTVASWVLLVSLHARNPVLLNGGDSLLRRLLFWSVFLPLGEKWSVDAVRKDSQKQQVTNLASAALLLQVVMIYTVNAIFKLRGGIWTNGEAILYVFSLDQLTVLFGDILSQYPDLLVFLNYVWLVMVIFSAGLILLRGRSRAVFASLFVVMHLGMLLTMNLGLFPLISIAGLIPFLPREVWDGVP
ncbi:MAG: HTTM domain-containing protein, partial [Halobacteria archaeon]|nr:HTTM domain-containing protein [Halobacteria archaeon]